MIPGYTAMAGVTRAINRTSAQYVATAGNTTRVMRDAQRVWEVVRGFEVKAGFNTRKLVRRNAEVFSDDVRNLEDPLT
jgi:hypothetical protein